MNGWNAKTNTALQFSPKFVYNQINEGENKGSKLDDNYFILCRRGCVKYSQFTPLTRNDDIEYLEWCENTNYQKEALNYKVTSKQIRAIAQSSVLTPITNVNSSSLNTIKQLLATGHVLTFSTNFGDYVSDSTHAAYSSGYSNENWIYDELQNGEKVCIQCENISPIIDPDDNFNHALSIVGYDDTIWYDYDGDGIQDDFEMGAFKIANSHGTGYGNSGYIWAMYDSVNKSSNCSDYNQSDRIPLINYYRYYSIEVGKSNLDLTAEITVSQTDRSQHIMFLKNTDSNNVTTDQVMVSAAGGQYGYDGTELTNAQSTTFVVDYDNLVSGDREWRSYGITVFDRFLGVPTTINEISLVDRTGKIVCNESMSDIVDYGSINYEYYIGMVGDVNNNGIIDSNDILRIQRFLSGDSLTNNEMVVADVNGDGLITIQDCTLIQKKIVGLISDFPNGVFAYIDN